MLRRRRITREIPFSFDSFLDVVANVVGIIIRLILVVWVGARSYSSIQELAKPKARPTGEAARAVPEDPLQHELALQRQELADLQARLLEQLRQLNQVKAETKQVEGKLSDVLAEETGLDQEQHGIDQAKAQTTQTARAAEW